MIFRSNKAWWHMCVLLCAALMLQGCGIKLLYNNADRLTRWWVNDYIDMSPAQRKYFDASAADVHYWHRTTQLALYRDRLLELRGALADRPMTAAELDALVADVEGWGQTINARITPIAQQMLLSLSAEQLVELERAFAKSNRSYAKQARRAPDAIAREDARNYSRLFRRLVGRLDADQRELILRQHLALAPDAQSILDYREQWQARLVAMLSQESPDRDGLEDLFINFDKHYTPEFEAMLATNEQIYRELTLGLMRSLSNGQRQRLSSELDDLIEICDELIADAPSEVPLPAVPLVI